MGKRQETQREYKQYLRWYAAHDYYASIALVIATFTILPAAILLIPTITFIFLAVGSKRISTSAREKLATIVKIPRNVILLQADTHQISIFSLPFISILKVPEYILREKDTKELAIILDHELSHHVRHDTTKLIWVSVGACFLFYYFASSILINLVFFPNPDSDGNFLGRFIANLALVSLIVLLISLFYITSLPQGRRARSSRFEAIFYVSLSVIAGMFGSWVGYQNGLFIEPYASVTPPPEVRRLTIQFWGPVIVSCAFLMILFLRGMCHRMEHLADLEAAEKSWDSHTRYWASRASPKLVERGVNYWTNIFNRFLHPSDSQRYAAVAGHLNARSSSLFLYSFIWSLVCCFSLLRAVTDGRSSFGEKALRTTNDLGLMGLIVVFFVIGYGVYSLSRLHGRLINLRNIAVFLGYMTGTILAFFSVYLFERSAFGFEHLRPQGISDFLLLTSASFFPLLFVTYLATGIAKTNKLSAIALVALCLFLSTLIASLSLTEGLVVPPAIVFVIYLTLAIVILVVGIMSLKLLNFALSTILRK